MLIIGSHVNFNKETQLLGALEQALSYNANALMLYTGAPQNTKRSSMNEKLTKEAKAKMQETNFSIENIIAHAPYIINLANNNNQEQYNFSINFLIEECQRCQELGIKKIVLHPGSHVGIGKEQGIINIANALNKVLPNTNEVTILLETMAGKGTEIGRNFEELKMIIDKVILKEKIGICLDTCHLSDSGYDVTNFDNIIAELKKHNLLEKVGCIHLNDSKNPMGSNKDRHENIGFGSIPFESLLKIIYHPTFENIPKILETPWVEDKPPYKEEIEEIKTKTFNPNLKEDIKKEN